MRNNDTNDRKITDKVAPAEASPQPQKHFRPSIEDEAIPWAEIIFEAGPNFTERSTEATISPSVLSSPAENYVDYQVVGPPLAVLAIVLLVFLLLVAM
jgi:hypothetical protein